MQLIVITLRPCNLLLAVLILTISQPLLYLTQAPTFPSSKTEHQPTQLPTKLPPKQSLSLMVPYSQLTLYSFCSTNSQQRQNSPQITWHLQQPPLCIGACGCRLRNILSQHRIHPQWGNHPSWMARPYHPTLEGILLPDGGNSIYPPYSTIEELYETPDNSHALSAYHPIYECTNTAQLINFYHATMGYPVVSTWCKAIDKGYFRGWNGLTSDRARKFIRPSSPSEQGHMDQRRAYIRPSNPYNQRSTQSCRSHDRAPTSTKQ
eukprot:CCRYP_019273-RA/>CCRYP_019273-RA protein AED:0.41 eAED:0.41 QI:0/0/0/1/0/0/2/0/262